MADETFHKPTELELAFLRIVTRGLRAFSVHVESCEISTYDPIGYYDVRVVDAPALRPYDRENPVRGALITYPDATHPPLIAYSRWPPDVVNLSYVDTLLWADRGFLASIEVVSVGDGYIVDPCSAFVDAAAAVPPLITFASERHVAKRQK
jgi:hypothetical protein